MEVIDDGAEVVLIARLADGSLEDANNREG